MQPHLTVVVRWCNIVSLACSNSWRTFVISWFKLVPARITWYANFFMQKIFLNIRRFLHLSLVIFDFTLPSVTTEIILHTYTPETDGFTSLIKVIGILSRKLYHCPKHFSRCNWQNIYLKIFKRKSNAEVDQSMKELSQWEEPSIQFWGLSLKEYMTTIVNSQCSEEPLI